MLTIRDLTGTEEGLTYYKNLTRKQRVNGERSISFFALNTPANAHAYRLIVEESMVAYDGVDYRIKEIEERTIGNTPVKIVTAEHTFFGDFIDVYHYDGLTEGQKSINELLSFTFRETGYTFSVIDTFATVEIEKFGEDNALALFQKILEHFRAEFDLVGKDVRIRSQIGGIAPIQFRYKHNIKTFSKTIRTDNLSTYIKGFGKELEDGTYAVTAEYTSPLVSVYGKRHAPPVKDDRYTDQASLLARLQREIQDTPEVAISLEFVELKSEEYGKPGLGDIVPTIYEPLGVDVDLRILEMEDYPESNKSPKVQLANFYETAADVVFRRTKSMLDKIYDENSGKIRYNVYNEAVKRATEALNNSLTELEYPAGMGIVARDPNDPNRFVVLRSAGIGVTTDGGLTYGNAITADGVTTNLLTAGQIKTNNIQIIGNDDLFYWDGNYLIAIDANDPNKYVRLNSDGLYTAKGAITIERPDGFKVINNGMSVFDVNIQGVEPMFHSPGVTLAQKSYAQWLSTRSAQSVDFNQYSFEHKARYLKVRFRLLASGGNSAHFEIWKDGQMMASAFTTVSDENDPSVLNGSTLTVDLGVPTGQPGTFQIRFRSSIDGQDAFAHVTRKWLEG